MYCSTKYFKEVYFPLGEVGSEVGLGWMHLTELLNEVPTLSVPLRLPYLVFWIGKTIYTLLSNRANLCIKQWLNILA